jgi:SSS family transporter
MNYLDWIVIIVYMGALMGIALYYNRTHHTIRDYYLAGKNIKWWQSGFSVMATQLGAVSFVSAPAFVALKQGGGLKWLCYEFGVPLGLLIVMAFILPCLHRGNFISIYEYLESRFDSSTRLLMSSLFQLGRGLATAVAVLAGGLILSTALSISTAKAILLVGAVTILYDVIGGIRVVIISDVLQMLIIMVGIFVCGWTALSVVGWETAWGSLSPDRRLILDFGHWGVSAEGGYAFWPMLIGGIFLYASYYGCDQSQMQRQLTVNRLDDAKKSILLNALGRFPLVFLYCLVGVLVGGIVLRPEFLTKVAVLTKTDPAIAANILRDDPDRMLPFFILSYLPHGLIGFILVGIMAALMSSLDSALNSLSAVTIRDFYQRYVKPAGDVKHYLIASKICTLCWGVFCVAVALLFTWIEEATRQTTIVLINAIGSLLYGPVLAVFVLGILTTWAKPFAVKVGVLTGVLSNVFFWLFTPVAWIWWNFSGLMITIITAISVTLLKGMRLGVEIPFFNFRVDKDMHQRSWVAVYKIVLLYFFLIIIICYIIQQLLT